MNDVKKFTTIGISKKVWKALNSKKEVGESFDRLLTRLLDLNTGVVGEEIE